MNGDIYGPHSRMGSFGLCRRCYPASSPIIIVDISTQKMIMDKKEEKDWDVEESEWAVGT